MKYFLIAIGVLILAGAGTLTFNNKESGTDPETAEQKESATVSETDEYVVDPSDMYSVQNILSDNTTSTITENEKDWLILFREEEKLARDVYLTLGDRWGVRIFSNIASSEQTHTDAIKVLLEHYNLPDPVTSDKVGVFTNPELQKLYDSLTTQGSESLLAALVVGATVEDLDINDLDKAMAENTKDNIRIVYQNLQKGSRNHMRAFVRQVERNGGTYTPQYISESDYEDIVSSSQERGRIE